MQQFEIRPLENDRERYEQLKVIHGLSGRLNLSSQVYDELHHLHRALSLLRREWTLDRIQPIVSTLASPPSSSPNTLTQRHGHAWYPLVVEKNKSSSSGLVSNLKNWFGIKTTRTTTTRFKRRRKHLHLLVRSDGHTKIRQLIQDFQGVFEENARQNKERMHQLYSSLFHHTGDPLLAEDIQRLCLALTTATPPPLASLVQPCVTTMHNDSTDDIIWPDGITKRQENTGMMQEDTSMVQGGSICLGLLSEHLLQVGQHYYTTWIQDIERIQQQQMAPYQVATDTLAAMYRALQIEQGYALLTRLCTLLEPARS
ncbi:hypothetical protein BC941DRAFT_426942 [Chlamydoabsidia padenii]|nr:hypothetical protein BC941DRAFT_426942 [Chlamydoabsidia padenii]